MGRNSKKRAQPTAAELSKDMDHLFKELNEEESDRSVSIVATAYIDDALGSLLRARLCLDKAAGFKGQHEPALEAIPQPGELAGRLRWCFALGLIGPDMYHDLDILRDIRNRFAHVRGALTFDEAKMSEAIRLLKTPKVFDGTISALSQPRPRFTLAVVQLLTQLLLRALEQPRLPVGKDFGFGGHVKLGG